MADDLVARTRAEIRARLEEIAPLLQEREKLERALAALEQLEPAARQDGSRPARRARRRPSARAAGERAPRGQRRQQLLALVAANPGITPTNAAQLMGVSPSQVSTLARRLEQAGETERRDGGLVATAAEGT